MNCHTKSTTASRLIANIFYNQFGHSPESPSHNHILWSIDINNNLYQISEKRLKEKLIQTRTNKSDKYDLEPIHENWNDHLNNKIKASGRVNYDDNNATVIIEEKIDQMSRRYKGTLRSIIKRIIYHFKITEDKIHIFK